MLVLDQVGARHLMHHRDGDDNLVAVLHSRAHLCLCAYCLMLALGQQVQVRAFACWHSCNNDNIVIIVASIVGDGRSLRWGPAGVLE